MQIDRLKNNPLYQPGSGNPQSVSIEQRIEKLTNRKRKIEEDLAKRSTNPDPKAAQGDNIANSAVNRKILQQLEQQIQTLAQQRNYLKNESAPGNKLTTNAISRNKNNSTGNNIDLFA
jgi:hypothetical protein